MSRSPPEHTDWSKVNAELRAARLNEPLSQSQLELFDRVISGQASPEEQRQWQELTERNPEFSEWIDEHQIPWGSECDDPAPELVAATLESVLAGLPARDSDSGSVSSLSGNREAHPTAFGPNPIESGGDDDVRKPLPVAAVTSELTEKHLTEARPRYDSTHQRGGRTRWGWSWLTASLCLGLMALSWQVYVQKEAMSHLARELANDRAELRRLNELVVTERKNVVEGGAGRPLQPTSSQTGFELGWRQFLNQFPPSQTEPQTFLKAVELLAPPEIKARLNTLRSEEPNQPERQLVETLLKEFVVPESTDTSPLPE